MSFIIRNLGWILLITFFIFMLYLISGQNDIKKNQMLAINNVVNSGSNVLENEKKYNESKINSEKSFASSIKDFFKSDKKDNKTEITTEKEKDKKTEKKNSKKTKTNDNKVKTLTKKEYIKNSSEIIKEKIIKRNKRLFHTVGVKSIVLNNAYFTKRLGYAYKGDKLEQKTDTNRYGCFNSEVLESKISKGKKGWTCIYYMEGHLNEMSKYRKKSMEYYKTLREKRIAKKIVANKINISNQAKRYPIIEKKANGDIIITTNPHKIYEGPVYMTEVGSLYLVKVNSLKLNNKNFIKQKGNLTACTEKHCDVLEQLTPIDKDGCFKVNVVMGKNNKNKTGWVCQKYLR